MVVRAPLLVAVLASVWVAGCEEKKPPPPPAATPAPPPPAGSTARGSHFEVAMSADACAKDATCTVRIALTSSSGFHVNPEFPHKFSASPAEGVEFVGPPALERPVGKGETSATMLVKFKPSRPGRAEVAGTFRFGICNERACEREDQPLAMAVPVN